MDSKEISKKYIILFLRIFSRDKREEYFSENELNQIIKDIGEFKNYVVDSIKKAISCEDKMYTIVFLIQIYILMKITSLLNDKFIIYLILNILLLYAPLEKKCPHFLFKARMTFKQVIEGIIGLLVCLIPKYEDPQEKNEKNI